MTRYYIAWEHVCGCREGGACGQWPTRLGMQGRTLLARVGRRTVLILDVPYVHHLLEAYVAKLFSLSYGCASVDVHGADPADHFVHCFTHRCALSYVCFAYGERPSAHCSKPHSSCACVLVSRIHGMLAIK